MAVVRGMAAVAPVVRVAAVRGIAVVAPAAPAPAVRGTADVAMPAPITSFLLNEKFNDCPEIAASMVLVGTLMGVVTIPLVLEFSQRCLMAF